MKNFVSIILAALIVLTAAIISPANAHGLTPELQVVFMRALVEKCKADQPSLTRDLDSSLKLWKKRNAKYVANVDAIGETELANVMSQAREAYSQSGTFTLDNCQKLSADLKTSATDIKTD